MISASVTRATGAQHLLHYCYVFSLPQRWRTVQKILAWRWSSALKMHPARCYFRRLTSATHKRLMHTVYVATARQERQKVATGASARRATEAPDNSRGQLEAPGLGHAGDHLDATDAQTMDGKRGTYTRLKRQRRQKTAPITPGAAARQNFGWAPRPHLTYVRRPVKSDASAHHLNE